MIEGAPGMVDAVLGSDVIANILVSAFSKTRAESKLAKS